MDKEQKEIEEGVEVGSLIFNALCKATRGTGIEVMVEVEVTDKQEDFNSECISYQIDLDITRAIMVVLEEDKEQEIRSYLVDVEHIESEKLLNELVKEVVRNG